jgi:hypothetical protein
VFFYKKWLKKKAVTQLFEKIICQGFPISFRFLNSPFLTPKMFRSRLVFLLALLAMTISGAFATRRIERGAIGTLGTAPCRRCNNFVRQQRLGPEAFCSKSCCR